MEFRIISSITPDDQFSWKNKLFLTFDIDWAHDDIINYTIDLIEQADIAATWFITHDTPVLSRLRTNLKYELGIHPNFNFILNGNNCNGSTAEEVIERVQSVVPEAKSVRSHSMTQSSGILNLFKKKGLTHDVNQFIPIQTGSELIPWKLWNNLVRVPYNWEDDVHCMYDIQDKMLILANYVSGLRVFNFHPIHIFLNTENLERYERTRPLHQNPKELIKYRYDGYGTHRRLLELIEFSRRCKRIK